MIAKNAFWQDKCVLVTGASSGIGEALAKHLLTQGAKVGLIARRQSLLEKLAGALAAQGRVAWACADVTDAAGLAAAVKALEQQLGPCQIMIANAGVYRKTEVSAFAAATQNAVINTNVQGVINSVAAVLPGMIARKQGHIVAVSSISAMLGLPGAGAYCASKAAVNALFQSLRVDLHGYGVRATVVAPGFVDTPIITEEERASLKDLLTAEQAATRICLAIQRNRALDWFPWQTWLACRLFSFLPSGLYRRVITHVPEMEEANPKQ
jgi:NADP-dependent 3-hydroxy acid dehydrogenase YdfG